MTLANRLKSLRQELGLSQEAVGAQGFVSTPGWIKIENGQRSPSEKLLEAFVRFYAASKPLNAKRAQSLLGELLTLKYLGSNAPFLRELAREHALTLPNAEAILAKEPKPAKPRRGRPANARSIGAQ